MKSQKMKEIKGFEGLYAVDDCGKVYSLIQTSSRRKGMLKPYEKNGKLWRGGGADVRN